MKHTQKTSLTTINIRLTSEQKKIIQNIAKTEKKSLTSCILSKFMDLELFKIVYVPNAFERANELKNKFGLSNKYIVNVLNAENYKTKTGKQYTEKTISKLLLNNKK